MSRDKKMMDGGTMVAEPGANVQRLEDLGRDVLSAMQSVRELLSARSIALEDCKSALDEEFLKAVQEQETLAEQEAEWKRKLDEREAHLKKREKHAEELSQKCE